MSLAGRRYGQSVITGLVVAGAFLLTACGSSGGGDKTTSPAQAPATGTATATATAATTGAGTPADAATKSAVTKAFQDFFDYQSTAEQSRNALQDGDKFKAVLDEQGKQSYAQKSAATVSSVRLLSANTARVVFSVLVGGQALLPDADGYAVRIGGQWKVAATTFCTLLTLEGDKAPACSDPSVTALPK